MNILLADDHRILRTGLKLLLASQDDCHVVAEASNGQEVLERLEDTPVDVVLLDPFHAGHEWHRLSAGNPAPPL